VRAGDEPKKTDALFSPIPEGDKANAFNDDEYLVSQKTSANSKRTVTPDNISQNYTSHHAPKCLKNSDESEPDDNDDDVVDFLCDWYPTDDDSDTTNATTNNHENSHPNRKRSSSSNHDNRCSKRPKLPN
jgi:hypothetical protein